MKNAVIQPKTGPWKKQRLKRPPLLLLSDKWEQDHGKFAYDIVSKDGFIVARIYKDGTMNRGQAKAHADLIMQAPAMAKEIQRLKKLLAKR